MATTKHYKLYVQGDRWTFTEDMPAGCQAIGTALWMQLKQYANSPEPGYGIAHNNLTAIALSDTSAKFTFSEDMTSAIPRGPLLYEIKMSTLALGTVTVYEGTIEVIPWAGDTPTVPTFALLEGEATFGFDTEAVFTPPPVVNAGSDAGYDLFTGTPYQLAGSATGDGPITYLWSKVSGPGVATFADATNPTTTVTFTLNGSVVLRLAATNAAGTQYDDVTITVTAALSVLFGSALKGEYHSDIGYNTGTHAWADQSGAGNDLAAVGTPTVNAGAVAGYSSISYSSSSVYHRRTSFTGLPTGTLATVIVVAKRDATADTRAYWCLPGRCGLRVSAAADGGLVATDPDASKQSSFLSYQGTIDTRTDRFHVMENHGDLATYYDGKKALDAPAGYTGLASAATELRLGMITSPLLPPIADEPGVFGLKGELVAAFVIAGTITQTQRETLCQWLDAKYGLTMIARSKHLMVLGQSNGQQMGDLAFRRSNATYVRPRNSRLYRGAVTGTALCTGANPEWGPSDPLGYRAAAAADFLASGTVTTPVIVWDQGESDTPGVAYTNAVVALIADMDTRMGRSDTLWVIPPIHPSSAAAAQRPYQMAVQAALPSRVILVSIDDLTMVDSLHLDGPSHKIKWLRILAAIDAFMGTSDWAG